MNNTTPIQPAPKRSAKPHVDTLLPIKLYDVSTCHLPFLVAARPKDLYRFFREHHTCIGLIDRSNASENSVLMYKNMHATSKIIDNKQYFNIEPAQYTDDDITNLLLEPPQFKLNGRNNERHDYSMHKHTIVSNWGYSEWGVVYKVLDFLRSFGHADWEGNAPAKFIKAKTMIKTSPLARIAFEWHRERLEALARFTA